MKRILTPFLVALFFLSMPSMSHAQTRALVYTNYGTFTVELREDLVPITAGNFIGLVETKFYDGVIFHRVIDGFVIQGGDPTGTGSGGSGVVIPDEFSDSLSNVVRTLSMANSGPNTGTSQFFINLVNNTFLDYDKAPLSSAHPVFGEVVEGWDVVQAIEVVPTNAFDRPLTDVVMDSVRIESTASSIADLAANIRSFSLHPNPVDASSWLELQLDHAERITLQVLDASGKASGENLRVDATAGSNRIGLSALQLSALPKGTHFLMVSGALGDVRALAFTR